jgi:general secretion pathway protein D
MGATTTPGAVPASDLTGSFLGAATPGGPLPPPAPEVIPNPFGNTLLIRATPQEYEQILNLLRQLDLPPRQVLIDAKIYEVDLTADLAAGVESYLQRVGSNAATGVSKVPPNTPEASRTLAAVGNAAGLGLTTGLLVLKSHELLAALTASDSRLKGRVISSPSIIATDGVPATMNVGSQVPTLSSVASTGVQQGGSSVFANNISNVGTGTTLSILARVNSSGVVTMIINQQVSAPIAPQPGSAIQSPSFSNRSLSTQMTVQDGDTVAIGGIIQENHTDSTGGVPVLNRIPVLGAAFGAKSSHTDRTELIIFLTPRVIYDTTQLADATEELKSNLKRVGKLVKDQ